MMEKISVMLQIFSGRENPTWILPENIFSEIEEKIDTLPVIPIKSTPLEKLGYNGVQINTKTQLFHIFNEIISISEGENIFQKKDIDRKIEQKLLKSAPAHLHILTESLL